jgi:hypothetical protein
MRQLTPQKLRQMTCTKLKCVKNHPKKVRQLTWKKRSASKITPKSASIDMEKMICVKNHPASQFCASKITLRQFSTRQRPRVKGHAPKSKSQNSRVTVPCVKHSVRHKTSTPFEVIEVE